MQFAVAVCLTCFKTSTQPERLTIFKRENRLSVLSCETCSFTSLIICALFCILNLHVHNFSLSSRLRNVLWYEYLY